MLVCVMAKGQELFVFTEPASNMATRSIGLRLNNYLATERASPGNGYQLIPEVMFGISKNFMLHADGFFGTTEGKFSARGASLYGKYRFYNKDDVQRHFRMALFARASFNNSEIVQEEINLYGRNSGFEAGIVATQLLHKLAISSGLSYTKAIDNGSHEFLYGTQNNKALNFTLSFGKLMLPREYKDYRQTNLNLMLEFLNQLNIGSGRYYLDAAPALQLIFNSQARVDIGYRQQLHATLARMSANGLFIRLEYNFFNAYK